MSEYLPEEVLTEIFLRLPINSIIQCTSVCKSWYAFITSPCFISTHLKNQDEHLLVRRCYVDPKEHTSPLYWENPPAEEIYALYCDNDNFDQYAQFSDVPPKCTHYHFHIVGSCNGLLCLSDDLYMYPNICYLWNPSIRKSLQLPKPIFTHGSYDHILGFGFDPVTNDYKVVRIVHERDGCDGCYEVQPNVELYKLSTGVWQDITHTAPAFKLFQKRSGVFMNGACHWAAYASRKIVLFDVQDETFREMMLPGNVEVGCWFGDDWGRLFVSEESLCFADRLFDDHRTIDIWRMKVYGDSESWVKHYSIDYHITFNVGVDEFYSWFHYGRQRQESHFLVKPLASRRNGEILWRAYNGNLVSYDIANENIKNLGIHNANLSPYQNALYVCNNYKASLILLDKQTVYFPEKYGKKVSRKLKSSWKHKKNELDDDDDDDELESIKRKKRGRSKRRKIGKSRGHSDSEEDGEDKDHDDSSDEDEDRHRRRKSRKEKRRRRRRRRRRIHRHTDSSAESSDDSPPWHKCRSRRAISASDSDGARVGRDKKRSKKRSRKRHDDEE